MDSPGEVLITKIILDTATFEDFTAVSDTYAGIEEFMKAVNSVLTLHKFQIGTIFDFEQFRTYDSSRVFNIAANDIPGYFIYCTNGQQSFYIRHVPRL